MIGAAHAFHWLSAFSGPARPAAHISLLATIASPSMRSRPATVDPLAPGRAGFAHRGLHLSAPENSIGAFEAALELGAGIECDLGLTADNRVVVFHDRDATRICGSSLEIASSRWSDLRRLKVGKHGLPTIEVLFGLVNGRVPLLLDVKVRKNRRRWAGALAGVLSNYHGRFGVMSFDALLPRLLRMKIADVRCGLIIPDGMPAWKRELKMLLASPDFIAVEHTALDNAWVANARFRMPVYAWTVRTSDDCRRAAARADAVIWADDGRPQR